MSRKSFSDIEQVIKNAAEANEPAFDEAAWKKMEALLDKEDDRKRPVVFWLWWLLPLVIGGATISYFVFNKTNKQPVVVISKNEASLKTNNNETGKQPAVAVSKNEGLLNHDNTNVSGAAQKDPGDQRSGSMNEQVGSNNSDAPKNTAAPKNSSAPGNTDFPLRVKKTPVKTPGAGTIEDAEQWGNKNMLTGNSKSKMKASIVAPGQQQDDDAEGKAEIDTKEQEAGSNPDSVKKEEIIVVKIDPAKTGEKEIEKIVDSLISKKLADKKTKNRIAKFYVIVAAGVEGSGVKLFSTDKITSRLGLSAGYQFNKNLSVQAGFYTGSKKYKAGPGDYKTKPGSYWDQVIITDIDANCKVYEIPVSLRYDFTPGKKLNLFASVGLSSYIMKKEEYHISYDRYGTPRETETYYNGNKNLFSLVRLTAGAQKKIARQFDIFLSPGIAIPLSGVGDGEVKLFSVDSTFGLKFTPGRKK
ncbi:MAG: porin family protein [Chitinophagaceae bacterium]|nr:porin family protein [Chitinophagaceae bacterium]